MKTCLTTLLGLLVLLAGGASAHAQYPNARPAVSPWMNLYRGGSTATFNYQTLVRPEMDFRSSIQALQQQSRTNQQGIADLEANPGAAATLPVTGHAAGFMTQNSYFQTLGGGAVGGRYAPVATPVGGLGTPNRGTTAAPTTR